MRKWSKLQKALYNIVDPDIKFQIHCSVFWTNSSWVTKTGKGRPSVPRYWITIGKEIVWDFPNMFLEHEPLCQCGCKSIKESYYYNDNYTWIPETIRAYIDTPKEDLLITKFENDIFGFVDVLRAVDRRIGKDKRKQYMEKIKKEGANSLSDNITLEMEEKSYDHR